MGSEEAYEATVVVANPLGLHSPPIIQLVGTAKKYPCTIEVALGESRANAKNPAQLVWLEARQGAELQIRAQGQDAKEAVLALVRVIAGFED